MNSKSTTRHVCFRFGAAALAAVVLAAPLFLAGCKPQKAQQAGSPAGPPKIEGAKVHPTVFVTPADIGRARENVERFDWAKQTAEAVLREADGWLAKDDAWLRSVVPPQAGLCLWTVLQQM